ncbi:MAG TPA: hypothetical protein VIM62_06125 [Acidobacteriaceae bacterium]
MSLNIGSQQVTFAPDSLDVGAVPGSIVERLAEFGCRYIEPIVGGAVGVFSP